MRSLVALFSVGVAACSNAQTPPTPAPTAARAAAPESGSYSVLLREDGQTWCAFRDAATFQAEVEKLKPTDSARVTFSAEKLTELTYQIEAESGDWIVVDQYTPQDGSTDLRRANLLAQDNRQVIQEATIRGGKADPFRLISVSTLDGKKAEPSPNADLPDVPVQTSLDAFPFVRLVVELRNQSVGQLCKKLN